VDLAALCGGDVQNWVTSHGISVAAIGVASLIALFGFLRPVPPPIEVRPRDVQPSPTTVIYVHVDGAVQLPGVYELASGGRVFEAIAAAGGETEDADLHELNLAARVTDGQKLVIPGRAFARVDAPDALPAVAALPTPAVRAQLAASSSVAPTARINLNTATDKMLDSLPGIGPVTAARVIAYREANGPFTRVEQLRDARLVNAPTYERIRDLVSVE
jgi:competence protein ComEA